METLPQESDTSLLILNDDCLLHLFKILAFNDCMSLAETCTRLAAISRSTFQKCTVFTFNKYSKTYELNKYGKEYVDRIFYHIGSYLTSITLFDFKMADYVFSKIDESHNKLKNLICSRLPSNAFHNAASVHGFQNFETLKICGCDLKNEEDFFLQFCNLTSLYMSHCREVHKNALRNAFRRNQKISSVNCDHLQLQLLPLLTNLEKFCLYTHITDPNAIINLNRLKSLKLSGTYWGSANELLFILARKGILEELELELVYIVDDNTFVALKSFKKLHLLALSMAEKTTWGPSFTLPPNLKHLSLDNIVISTIQIASLIKELVCLENMKLLKCKILKRSGMRIFGFSEKCQHISNELGSTDYQKTINIFFAVFVVTAEYRSKVKTQLKHNIPLLTLFF